MKHEETKQLKKGQTLYLPVTVTEVLDSGNRIAFSVCYASRDGRTTSNISAYYEQLVLPSTAADKPKYDPCRLFKKGDKVKLREEVQGRETPLFMSGLSLGKIYTVAHDEYNNHTVDIIEDECLLGRYSFVYLELVTPVEELEPYIIKEYVDFYAVEKDGAQYSIFFKGSYYAKAKEAAEAECARLNAEHRKEQA